MRPTVSTRQRTERVAEPSRDAGAESVRFASAQPSMNPSLPVGSAHCVLGPTCSRLLIIALFVVPLTLWPQLLNCELAIIGTSFPSIAIPCSRFSKLHSRAGRWRFPRSPAAKTRPRDPRDPALESWPALPTGRRAVVGRRAWARPPRLLRVCSRAVATSLLQSTSAFLLLSDYWVL